MGNYLRRDTEPITENSNADAFPVPRLCTFCINDWPEKKYHVGDYWKHYNAEEIAEFMREHIQQYGSAPKLSMETPCQARKIYNYINTVTGKSLSADFIKEIRDLLVKIKTVDQL